MSTTIRRYVQAVIDQAGTEAQKEGAASIEAQHLLLAIAADPEAKTQQVLSAAGLDHQSIRTALQGSSSRVSVWPEFPWPPSAWWLVPG